MEVTDERRLTPRDVWCLLCWSNYSFLFFLTSTLFWSNSRTLWKKRNTRKKKKQRVKISHRIPQLSSTHDEELAYLKILKILHPVRFLVVNPVHTRILPINLPKGPSLHWLDTSSHGRHTPPHSVPAPGRAGNAGEQPWNTWCKQTHAPQFHSFE